MLKIFKARSVVRKWGEKNMEEFKKFGGNITAIVEARTVEYKSFCLTSWLPGNFLGIMFLCAGARSMTSRLELTHRPCRPSMSRRSRRSARSWCRAPAVSRIKKLSTYCKSDSLTVCFDWLSKLRQWPGDGPDLSADGHDEPGSDARSDVADTHVESGSHAGPNALAGPNAHARPNGAESDAAGARSDADTAGAGSDADTAGAGSDADTAGAGSDAAGAMADTAGAMAESDAAGAMAESDAAGAMAAGAMAESDAAGAGAESDAAGAGAESDAEAAVPEEGSEAGEQHLMSRVGGIAIYVSGWFWRTLSLSSSFVFIMCWWQPDRHMADFNWTFLSVSSFLNSDWGIECQTLSFHCPDCCLTNVPEFSVLGPFTHTISQVWQFLTKTMSRSCENKFNAAPKLFWC